MYIHKESNPTHCLWFLAVSQQCCSILTLFFFSFSFFIQCSLFVLVPARLQGLSYLVAYTCISGTWESEAGGSPWVQVSKGYGIRPGLIRQQQIFKGVRMVVYYLFVLLLWQRTWQKAIWKREDLFGIRVTPPIKADAPGRAIASTVEKQGETGASVQLVFFCFFCVVSWPMECFCLCLDLVSPHCT